MDSVESNPRLKLATTMADKGSTKKAKHKAKKGIVKSNPVLSIGFNFLAGFLIVR